MLVYILVLEALNRRNANTKFEAWKVAKFDNFEKFQYRHEPISLISYRANWIKFGIYNY